MSSDGKSLPPRPPVGIKDIARALGISTGTVDRALHGKPDVSAETRARVLSMAETLRYRPNLAARFLQSRKQLRVSVQLPRKIALFWDSLREGIREAAAPFAPALHVEFRSYPSLGEGDIPLFDESLHDGTNGLIIAPGNPVSLTPLPAQGGETEHSRRVRRHGRGRRSAADIGLGESSHRRRGRGRAAGEIPARRRRSGVLHRMAGDAGARRQAPRIRIEPEDDWPRRWRSAPSSKHTTTSVKAIGARWPFCARART